MSTPQPEAERPSTPEQTDPLLVEVVRGEMVESRHRGTFVVSDAQGRILASAGDTERITYARSAIKCLQALPLIESGAADRFGLNNGQLALACASHNGEPAHVECVSRWLEAIGCTVADLECGCHPPMHAESAAALIAAGIPFSPLHNNCSGKHAGFLSVARHQGIPLHGYINEQHPVQQQVCEAIEAMSGAALAHMPRGIDGCGIPVLGLPLRRIALAMARFADPTQLPAARRKACDRLRRAIAAEPFMLAGSARHCTRLIGASGGRALVKTGAEGVYTAIIPESGLGIAVKAEDGATRSAELIITTLLDRLGLLNEGTDAELALLRDPPLVNRAGKIIGNLRAVTTNFAAVAAVTRRTTSV